MVNKKSHRKKYKKNGGDNTSSLSRRKRREEIREKTFAAAERRRRKQTYRQPSYQPRQRSNLSNRYLDTYNPIVDQGVRHIDPFQNYLQRECLGHECDLLYPHSRRPIYDRAIQNRQRDYHQNAMSELNNRMNRNRRRNERNQTRMSLNRMMSEGNLDELDPEVSNNIMRFI